MKAKRPSLKYILDDLFEMFPFAEFKEIIRELIDPLDCKDTQEMMDALQSNMDVLRAKETHSLGGDDVDKSSILGYVENPSNFSKEQWSAIERTKQAVREYEREVDLALESGEIRKVVVDAKKALKSRRRQRMKRFKIRKKWIPM